MIPMKKVIVMCKPPKMKWCKILLTCISNMIVSRKHIIPLIFSLPIQYSIKTNFSNIRKFLVIF